jgi:nucleoid DNA-binding protein
VLIWPKRFTARSVCRVRNLRNWSRWSSTRSAIVRGETVKLSSFATFHVRDKNQRIGRNPKTGEEVPILPRRVMTFKASNVLKQKIIKGHTIARKK